MSVEDAVNRAQIMSDIGSEYMACDEFLGDRHYSDDGEHFTDFRGNVTTWEVLCDNGYSFWTWNKQRKDYYA